MIYAKCSQAAAIRSLGGKVVKSNEIAAITSFKMYLKTMLCLHACWRVYEWY